MNQIMHEMSLVINNFYYKYLVVRENLINSFKILFTNFFLGDFFFIFCKSVIVVEKKEKLKQSV